MKKQWFTAILLLLCLLAAGCAKNPSSSGSGALADDSVPLPLILNIILPAEDAHTFFGYPGISDEQLLAELRQLPEVEKAAAANGVFSITFNQPELHDKLRMLQTKQAGEINAFLQTPMAAPIQSITYNSDLTLFTITTKKGDIDASLQSSAAFIVSSTAIHYQVLSGNTTPEITVVVIDGKTGEERTRFAYPDTP